MAYLKYKADTIFNGFHFLDEKNVLIVDEEGVVVDIISHIEAGDDIQSVEGTLCPGLINCHCHLELSHMRGFIPERTGLVKFVLNVVQNRHFPEEKVLDAIEKAEDEMLQNGIVAVGDICNNTLTITQKIKGRVYYHNFIEATAFNPAIVPERFERSLGFFREYGKNYSIPIESNSIVPHAPYSVADELWELIIHFPGNHLMTIHNQEIAGENEWFLHKQGELEELYSALKIDTSFFNPAGKTSIQTYLPKFMHNQSVILVHNVHTSEEDIQFSKKSGLQLHWCLCPNANQYITGQLPPVDTLINNDCDIVLGTDSLASNHHLSVLEEMRTIHKNFPSIEIGTLLRWATSNGAKALQMDSLLGSFEKGKRPGVVLIADKLSGIKRLI